MSITLLLMSSRTFYLCDFDDIVEKEQCVHLITNYIKYVFLGELMHNLLKVIRIAKKLNDRDTLNVNQVTVQIYLEVFGLSW